MKSKKYIFKYEELHETIHRTLTKLKLIITAETILFKDKEFRNGLNNTLYRNALSYKLVESYPNKLIYSIQIDYSKFKILTDFSNNITRDINVMLDTKGLKGAESSVDHHRIWIKLP